MKQQIQPVTPRGCVAPFDEQRVQHLELPARDVLFQDRPVARIKVVAKRFEYRYHAFPSLGCWLGRPDAAAVDPLHRHHRVDVADVAVLGIEHLQRPVTGRHVREPCGKFIEEMVAEQHRTGWNDVASQQVIQCVAGATTPVDPWRL